MTVYFADDMGQAIERDSPLPLYHQLKQLLLDQIERGSWKPGDLIPGEQELQDEYRLSRTTVRQALRELELEGKVTRHRGRGTFVSVPKLTHSAQPKASLSDSLLAKGITPGWRVVARGLVAAAPDVAALLGVKAGADVHRLVRVRLANKEAIGVHVAHTTPTLAQAIDDGGLARGGSLTYLAALPALAGSRADRLIEAVLPSRDEVTLLAIDPKQPMLRIVRVVTAASGEPLEVLHASYRGDRFQYRVASVTGLGA
jgi:GntR family transcriptional regulator